MSVPSGYSELDIAVTGMACHFPDAKNYNDFWNNLISARESVRFYSDEHLSKAGVGDSLLKNSSFIKAGIPFKEIDLFDAEFFGLNPKEAMVMDPQHRHFLEVAWEALEDAGHSQEQFNGSIGVFAGCGMNNYFIYNIMSNPDLVNSAGLFFLRHTGNDKDFLATRVSYCMNLTGPSMSIQTACSTSLTAVHGAVQSLLNGECDIALAGAVTINPDHNRGYIYKEGEILSRGGQCRVFDHKADGTVLGSGAGVVVLRRIADAFDDRDTIHAIIKGTAINNDGSMKAGYFAPGVDGQIRAITEAITVGQIDPETISLVEAGTGTPIGDPIEISALTQAFRKFTNKKGFCRAGSVKSNIGHLDTAAGIAGLIKTVMALKEKKIPPSINYEKPNPAISFESSPFIVNTQLTDWNGTDHPRRAGVGAMGVGGSNAYVILEEPPRLPSAEPDRKPSLFIWSAKNDSSLKSLSEKFVRFCTEKPDINSSDIAYTLQIGRNTFTHRQFYVGVGTDELAEALNATASTQVSRAVHKGEDPSVVFMFPGQGMPNPDACRALYQQDSFFREIIDKSINILDSLINIDYKKFFLPDSRFSVSDLPEINQKSWTEPALFIISYAMAMRLIRLKIEPSVMAGEGVGEYVAACVSGVFNLEDALRIVAARGVLHQDQISGKLSSESFLCELLKVKFNAPEVPFISSLSGSEITKNEALDPNYWIRQFGEPSQITTGLNNLAKVSNRVSVELGPGEKLCSFLRKKPDLGECHEIIASFPCSDTMADYQKSFLHLVGKLWLSGCNPEWSDLWTGRNPRRIPLPTYAFTRKSFWIEPGTASNQTDQKRCSVQYNGASRPNLSTPYIEPSTEVQKEIAEIWEEVLGFSSVGIDDNFMELGGHSLLLTQIAVRLGKKFNVELSLKALFRKPTIAAFALEIEKLRKKPSAETALPIKPVSREFEAELSKAEFSSGNCYSFPVSDQQRQLWFLCNLAPDTAVYNIPLAFRIKGPLDYAALEKSIAQLIRQHESLRTVFVLDSKGLRQNISSDLQIKQEYVDLSAIADQDRKLTNVINQFCTKPFILDKGPLVRFGLVKLTISDHIFLLSFHHSIMDHASVVLFARELSNYYTQIAAGNPAPVPKGSRLQYADLVMWFKEKKQLSVLNGKIQFWKEQFSAEPPPLELPSDFPRPSHQSFRGSSIKLNLTPCLGNLISAYCKENRISPFTFFLTAFKLLLHKYTGKTDITVGCPFENRTHPDMESIIGCCMNTLPLRTRFSSGESFAHLLKKVQELTFAAHETQNVSFQQIVEAVHPPRDGKSNPLFQTCFMFQDSSINLSLADLECRQLEVKTATSKFDCTLWMWGSGDKYGGLWEYNTDLFEEQTIERMFCDFTTLIEELIQNPLAPVSEIEVCSGYTQKMIAELNATDSHYPKQSCFTELFEETVQKNSGRVAVCFENESLTYAELNGRADRVAQFLKNSGVVGQTVVGVYIERSIEMLVAVLGIMKSGAAYLPLDPSFPKDRLVYMLDDSAASFILTTSEMAGAFPEFRGKEICIDAEEVRTCEQSDTSYPLSPDNLAYIIYTSGSTGKPKGVQIEQRALVNFLCSMAKEPGIERDDVLLSVTTLSFDIAGLELFLPLIYGARIVISGKFQTMDGKEIINLVSRHDVTIMQATPVTYRLMIAAGWKRPLGVKILCGGEAIPLDLADQLIHREGCFWNMYGPTETTIWSSVNKITAVGEKIFLGRPIANTEFFVLDQFNNPVPIGASGELHIGGDGLARGYLNRPELTEERFVTVSLWGKSKRLYKTGDLVKLRNDGLMDFLGRLDHQVKIRGYRIELGEIEDTLAHYGSIQQCVVSTYQPTSSDIRIVAYMICNNPVKPSTDDLRAFLKKTLPDFMVPSHFEFVDRFILTPNGKIDKKALPVPSFDTSSVSGCAEQPNDETELRIAKIWEKCLGLQAVGINENFFSLGGHSLIAAQMFVLLEEEFGVALPLSVLFEAQTIKAIAELVRNRGSGSKWSRLVRLNSSGSLPPFFLVHGAEGNVLLYRDLARYLGEEQPVYALQCRGLDGKEEPYTTFEEMARDYINEIISVQPNGPYYLGGYCLGGAIAYEMAQQLNANGHKVALVSMFETYNLQGLELPRILKCFHPIQNVVYHLENLMSAGIYSGYRFFSDKLKTEFSRLKVRMSIVTSNLKRAKAKEWSGRYYHVQIAKVNDRAQELYQPKPLPLNVALFIPKKNFAGANDQSFGWGDLVEGKLAVHKLNVNPRGMLTEPFVKELGRALKKEVMEARQITEQADDLIDQIDTNQECFVMDRAGE
ncbi:multi-domain non-ribosomal peptide synthetase [Chitinispirillum alkaliphilum]|nr:multi-domain non-ribosomal peptide synthetase [Chitinispirillum alkaliphilum]